MKMVRKYANMAFLLVSVAAIAPMYGNPEVVADNQEEVAVKPENRVISAVKNAFKAIEPAIGPAIICLTVAFVAHNYIDFVAQRAINRHQKQQEDLQKFGAAVMDLLKEYWLDVDRCKVNGCIDGALDQLKKEYIQKQLELLLKS